ncbi:FitA-like ribbon-helix-helix domain-containing protein [Kocuria sp.]|uniref:FitA-like ribbon-helix-helix domain-containing protein n=1 Tax=Kocuria sp. TaxID=1871328 RepID=UPI0026DF4C1C|nr:hypothetical protein [Kocuria sp.]MDO5617892.1 hypothetical protein [Kocuria sp.]
MPNIQIKDVPAETHRTLHQRAAAAHQSLQEYLRSRLIAEAAQPTVDEVMDRVEARAGNTGDTVTMAEVSEVLRNQRAGH